MITTQRNLRFLNSEMKLNIEGKVVINIFEEFKEVAFYIAFQLFTWELIISETKIPIFKRNVMKENVFQR